MWRNTESAYGWVAIVLHWLMALLVVGLYLLGDYMVGLDYTHPWYRAAPDLHRGLGMVTGLLLVLRFAWRLANPRPRLLGRPWERRLGLAAHRLFYLLIGLVVVSGYLISTADGQPVSVFGWVRVPATLYGPENQEDVAGWFHAWFAHGLILLAALHTLAALTHHFLDRDATLVRMLRPAGRPGT